MAIRLKYKILMHGGIMIDEVKLTYGLYATEVPRLHSRGETIEVMVGRWQKVLGSIDPIILGDTIENLKKCHLVEVELTIQE